ncbi:RNA 3'-terminal phosphate cyclase [Lachnellula hyalina]|uniref:RNA 3'-terminal phosphate cyclase n=1 Tax=Lachnellula hyalina TaxID=1316788 RepID=A0A8H8R4N1_9HELO|nr:RNA 3'-terminal phosphate cyclase [Lachnellula hyalina]TVY27576.1 RNA 3'-terminal phosphate cyclase [Lachnellula hyalina]
MVQLDGRTGEGGGQLVRLAISLAAITGSPVRIENVRGNRKGGRGGGTGGGLKAQHTACIQTLVDATGAEVTGCSVGSKIVEFRSKLSPADLINRKIQVKADSAASILLVFQALLPFLLFAGDDTGSPVTATIQGGTNVSFSLSFEYLDQVLLPSLERFGVKVERKLEYRGWSHGSRQIGSVKFKVTPLPPGQSLTTPEWPLERGNITKIDVSIIVPRALYATLKKAILFELGLVFPDVEADFVIVEDSRHDARMYTLLVAHTSTGLRFGRDWLYDRKSKNKPLDDLSTEIAQKVVDELDAEVRKGGLVDEYLQDQLIVFQALAERKSSIPGSNDTATSDPKRVERMDEPFGDGSTHTTTARWVIGQLLPNVKWIDKAHPEKPPNPYEMSIVLDVNYIPRANNWPTGFSGYICGTIPFDDAPCASNPKLSNIGTTQPSTFTQCCNGPIINITSPSTAPSDPSNGASCLAYCDVDFARTIDNGTGYGFGDYWDCLSNQNADAFGPDAVTGSVTCGWVNTSTHEMCEISVSVEQSYYSLSTASAAMGNATASGDVATTATASKTFASCPAELTPTATSSAAATATGSKSNAVRVKGEVGMISVGTGLLMLGFGMLLFL